MNCSAVSLQWDAVSQSSNQVKDTLNLSFKQNLLIIPQKARGNWGLRPHSSWFAQIQVDVWVSCREKAAVNLKKKII